MADRAPRSIRRAAPPTELVVSVDVPPAAADLRRRLVEQNVAAACAPRDGGPAADVVRITGAGASAFRCADLAP